MRLIDADKLIYSEYTNMFDEQIVFDTVTKARVDSMPTIKAIPYEWIEKWAEKFYKVINGKKYYTGDGYDTVWDMIEDWEKENARD